MSVLDDFADVLSSGSVSAAGTIFKGTLPSTPDTVLALFETGGPAPTHAMNAGPGTALAEYPSVQLLARDPRVDNARFLCQKSAKVLDALGRRINGVHYQAVFAMQSPFFLKLDEAGRPIYAVNFACTRTPASSS